MRTLLIVARFIMGCAGDSSVYDRHLSVAEYNVLSLTEEGLLKSGKHVLVAYSMKPKAGQGYFAAAARCAGVCAPQGRGC